METRLKETFQEVIVGIDRLIVRKQKQKRFGDIIVLKIEREEFVKEKK